MQTMRYINLLDKTSNVKTRKCFVYNNTIFFAVPKNMISRAIGRAAINVKKLQERFGKKVKIIEEPGGAEDAEKFIRDIVEPVKFKSFEIRDGEMVIIAGGTQNKAILLGRNKKRFEELKSIILDNFGAELRII